MKDSNAVSRTSWKTIQSEGTHSAHPNEMQTPYVQIVIQPIAVNAQIAAAMIAKSVRGLFDVTYPRGPIRCIQKAEGSPRIYPVSELERYVAEAINKEGAEPQ